MAFAAGLIDAFTENSPQGLIDDAQPTSSASGTHPNASEEEHGIEPQRTNRDAEGARIAASLTLASRGIQMNDVNLLIGGKVVQSRSAATFERRNPVSGVVVTRSAAAAEADAIAALDAAAAAFAAWSALGPGV